MKVAFWASRHVRSILFLLGALVLGGLLGSFILPASLFPRVTFPRLRIDVEAGERPAERMAVEVTRPVEESLRAIPGVRGVQSATSRGSAQVWLNFDWGEDMTAALLQAQSQVNRLLPSMPQGTSFDVKRMDPTVFPVIAYSMTSDSRPLTELRDIAQYQLRPLLSTVSGVAKVDVTGGAIEEFRVTTDPARLQAHGLAISDVAAALSASNVLTAVGRIEDHDKLYLVITDTRLKSAEEIGATVLRLGGGAASGNSTGPAPAGVVRLSDVADVTHEPAPQFIRSTADGHDAVLFNVYQQPGGNTVDIAKGVRDLIATEQKTLPRDVRIVNWYDQSDLIVASAHSVRDAVLIGVGLAALVLLLFLRDWKITLVAALAVPVVLGVTALLLYLLGQSFNIMTLGGMAAAVGLIIDDAIVMSEHIVRRLHAPRSGATGDTKDRVLKATDEFSKPLIGSSLSTIIIHIPPAFMIGVAGAFFAALSLSMASSLVVSFLVAWLAIPVIASRWLKPKRGTEGFKVQGSGETPAAASPEPRTLNPEPHPAARRVSGAYGRLMSAVLGRPGVVLLPMLLLLGAGYFLYQRLESGFMPTVDEGGFIIDYIGPPGTSVTETDRMLRQVEAILARTPEVQTYSRRTGYSLGGDLSEANTGDFFVRLKPLPRRPIYKVREEVEDQIAATIPGLKIETAQLMEDLIGDLAGKPQPVVVNLYSDDQQQLEALALKVAAAVGKVDGVKDMESGVVPAGDAIDVEVDRVKASLEGVDPDSLSKSLGDLVSGSVTTQIQQGPKLVDVRVWVPAAIRNTTLDLGRLKLRAPDGHLFPLSRVAKLTVITGQPEITREDLKRMVAVTGRSDRDLGSTIRDVKQVLDTPGLIPTGVRYKLGGLYEQQQQAFAGLVKVIAAAAALVFLLLLFLYESFRVAIAIMLTTSLAIAFVFIGLWLTGTQLNISSLMGMVMIVGNVTEVAIFYYSEYADTLTEGEPRARLIAAGNYRMRAIAMTTTAAILALLPLALGIGQGSGMLQPLAIAIIAGLVAQLPLVLVVLPALLMLFGKARHSGDAPPRPVESVTQ
ncbi:MAG TPA: efflux RND transporter permease subunit [Tepidisphaeraceae bacterium]|nr:efflux RND transporter permease subunit [Tepidisphaeraceae bacterium]